MKKEIILKVNGEEREVAVEPRQTLLEILRNDMGLTGTKEGCGNGNCGTCTVLLDGKAVSSCLILAIEVEGQEITTIEGLAKAGEIHLLQKAFIEEGAIQCGFCSPGMILTAKAFLDVNPHPTEAEARQAISGNLCRCTGYDKIVRAILKVGAN
jgi:carbon-monoxide dehydrogenase small subunit